MDILCEIIRENEGVAAFVTEKLMGGMMKVEAFVGKIIKGEDERDGGFRIDAAAGSDSGNIVRKNRRLAMEDSVFVRRIWYDTIYARRHKQIYKKAF